jgi:carbon starvation protein
VFQETLAQFRSDVSIGHQANWGLNVAMSVLVCALWGGLLYIGNLETLWRMLGIANQLLATIALALGTTWLLVNAKKRIYALCTGVPFVYAVVTVFTAGIQSIQTWWSHTGLNEKDLFLMRLACFLAAVMLLLSAVIVADSIRRWYGLLFGRSSRGSAVTVTKPPA